MTSSQPDQTTSATERSTLRALLVVADPPAQTSAQWMMTPVAAVPLLLRNLIGLQRAGFAEAAVMGNGLAEDAGIRRLLEDRRLTMRVRCLPPARLDDRPWPAGAWAILDGLALHEKRALTAAAELLRQKENNTAPSAVAQSPAASQPEWIVAADAGVRRAVDRLAREAAPGIFVPGEEAFRLRSAADFSRIHESLLARCGLSNDSFMDRHVTRFFSRQFTRWFLNTPLTPNQITLISLVLGLVSAVLLAVGEATLGILGALFLQLSAWVDCSDGEVARLKFMESKSGSRLDIFCDNIVHWAVFSGIGVGLFRATDDARFLALGALALAGSVIAFVLLFTRIADSKHLAPAAGETASLADRVANRDFTYFMLFMACLERLDLFLLITAFGANLFAAYILYIRLRPVDRQAHQAKA